MMGSSSTDDPNTRANARPPQSCWNFRIRVRGEAGSVCGWVDSVIRRRDLFEQTDQRRFRMAVAVLRRLLFERCANQHRLGLREIINY